MTLNETSTYLKTLVDQWQAEYQANREKDPDNWPEHAHLAEWYEDFSIWVELKEKHL